MTDTIVCDLCNERVEGQVNPEREYSSLYRCENCGNTVTITDYAPTCTFRSRHSRVPPSPRRDR